MQTEALYRLFLAHPSVQTDTRNLQKGDLYFALKGAHFNGNTFARQALSSGAAYCVVDEDPGFISDQLIQVKDVLNTLQELAGHHRKQFSIPFIAITGSNGKTTTKEMVHEVLNSQYKTYTTSGNLNNQIGIPLTLLKIRSDAQLAVIEMGANHQKEIESYCRYTDPTHGIITNCGKAHLEGFGGEEGVKKGKGELFNYLQQNGGTAFLMKDYNYLLEMSKGIREIITYGTSGASVIGKALSEAGFLEVEVQDIPGLKKIKTQLVGNYNLPNILAAVAVGIHFKVPADSIRSALENYHPSNGRSQMIQSGTNRVILDAYNANPSSMRVAIENFSRMDGDKVLILGGMMELGEKSLEEHKAIIDLIRQFNWKNVVLVGGDYQQIKHPFLNFNNSLKAREWFSKQGFDHTLILLKGSRSMQMEKVLEIW